MGKFILIAGSNSLELEVTGKDEQETDLNTFMCLKPFVTITDEKNNTVSVDVMQRNTEDLRKRVHELVDAIKAINPRINRLSDYFDKRLQPDEWFYIALNQEISHGEKDKIILTLKNMVATDAERALNESATASLQEMRKVYKVSVFNGQSTTRIGEPDKLKRVCRYCHKSIPETSFKEIAHTISEALGNKSIITNDECDNCNHRFGDTLEQDFLSIFDLPRLLFNIRGKNGEAHKFIGDNYILEKDSAGKLSISYTMVEGEQTPSELPDHLQLKPHRKFPPQNTYKTLCKYAIGVLDNLTLTHLERTRKWLLGETEEKCLPKIACITYSHIFPHPQIMTYVRHDDSRTDLPHVVVEMRIMDLGFIYIMPFSDKDVYDFTDKKIYENFWSFFEIYSKVSGWIFSDYSSIIPDYPKISLNFS